MEKNLKLYTHTHTHIYTHTHAWVLSRFSHVWLFTILWTVARQAPLSMGILQARTLKWVAIPFTRGSFLPRDRTCVSYVSWIGRQILYHQCHLASPYTHTSNNHFAVHLKRHSIANQLYFKHTHTHTQSRPAPISNSHKPHVYYSLLKGGAQSPHLGGNKSGSMALEHPLVRKLYVFKDQQPCE